MAEIKKIPDYSLHDILPFVDRPARYIGGERGATNKDFEACKARILMAFPDVYEIGSGNLGQEILYHIINNDRNYIAERVYAPWDDFEKELKNHSIPLYSLESKIPARDFDLVAFTVPYELGYTGVFTILNSSGLPFKSSERGFPLVGMGGGCAFNPSVMQDYVDFFNLGDGEENILSIAEIIAENRDEIDKHRDDPGLKKSILERIAKLPGIFVPSIGRVSKNRAVITDLETASFPQEAIIPYFGDMKNRITLELFRGCTQGCRFCQAGYIYRPYRKRSPELLLSHAHASFAHTGHNEVSLSSLNTTDYPDLIKLVEGIISMRGNRPLKLSIPSSRISSFDSNLAGILKPYSSGSLTLAIEAGTERLRRVINKHTSDEAVFNTVSAALVNGMGEFKLYFMVGLPTETSPDVDSIIDVVKNIRNIYLDLKRNKEIPEKTNFQIKTSVSNFVPKPHTPFQWSAMDDIPAMIEKHKQLTPIRSIKFCRMQAHPAESSFLEGIISRGDSLVGKAIESAWEMGSRFESWKERLNLDLWQEAFRKIGLQPENYLRERGPDEVFPWDDAPSGIDKKFLRREYEKALVAEETPDCFENTCTGCGLWQDICISLPGRK